MVERLLGLLRDLAADLEDLDPERSVLSEIRDLGGQTVPLLIQALRHGEPQIRRMAAFALGQLGWSRDSSLGLEGAVPHLEQVLKADADSDVRQQAAEALWFVDTPLMPWQRTGSLPHPPCRSSKHSWARIS